MEFEVLSEEVEWEARRVAAAFGIAEWTPIPTLSASWVIHFEVKVEETFIEWAIRRAYLRLQFLYVGQRREEYDGCDLSRDEDGNWLIRHNHNYDELMARGLYCLGVEDEGILSQLPALNAHEKLELRLSLPREFWPKTWIDEEGA